MYQNLEYMHISESLEKFKNFRSGNMIPSIDFNHLNESEFEQLCFDILVKLGFTDVHSVGKTNAPDGGKDLIANEHISTLTGSETRKWIWQCKHSKKSLDRKEIAEISELLTENNAHGYGLFCSNFITPDTLNRLEAKKLSIGSNKITYYAHRELQSLLASHQDIAYKYKLLAGGVL